LTPPSATAPLGGGAATLAPYRIPMFRRFQTDRDIVLIDQRGTGDSNPLDCSSADASQDDDLQSLEDYPVRRFRECLDTLDADPRLYTTAIAMDDVDDVRRYLGYEAINLWGGSYGTRAALVYLKRHESAVRSAVLDGVAPPDMRLPLYAARDSQRALDRLLDDCAGDAVCARAFPDLRGTVATLWAQLADRPRVAFTHPRTGERREVTLSPRLISIVIFQSLYSPDVASLLPRLLTDAAGGNVHGLLALAFNRDLPKGAMSDGLFLSVVCAEDLPRIADPSRLQAWIVTTAKREALLLRMRGQRTVSMTRADDSEDETSGEWDLADQSPIAEDALEELQQLNGLRNALERLDERCRDLLLLLFRDEDDKLSYDDVARRLGTSVGSIGPTRSRCLDKLRRSVI